MEVCACGALVEEKPDMVVARTEVMRGVHDVHEAARPATAGAAGEGGRRRSVSRRKGTSLGLRPTQFSSSRQTAVNKHSVPFPQSSGSSPPSHQTPRRSIPGLASDRAAYQNNRARQPTAAAAVATKREPSVTAAGTPRHGQVFHTDSRPPRRAEARGSARVERWRMGPLMEVNGG